MNKIKDQIENLKEVSEEFEDGTDFEKLSLLQEIRKIAETITDEANKYIDIIALKNMFLR